MTDQSEPQPPVLVTPLRGRWLRRAVVGVLAAVVVALLVSNNVSSPYYVLTPGDAQPVAPLISVPAHLDHRLHGEILLTDVLLTTSPVSWLQYWWDENFTSDAQAVRKTTLLGPYTPETQLVAQGYLEMAQSQAAAKATALGALGYRVPTHDAGVILTAVTTGTPAAGRVSVGQIIVGVDKHRVTDFCTFVGALSAYGPGDMVSLTVEKSSVTPQAEIKPGKVESVAIRMARRTSGGGVAVTGCPGVKTSSGYLGIVVKTQVDYTYPVSVSVRTTTIGGPSAGLAMTLEIINKLSTGDLTGGRTIAATGTIAPTGAVGPVGGVPQKTVAVERAGATVFFVPKQNYRTAEEKDVPSLHVYEVGSLHQVLSILRSLGGKVPGAQSEKRT